jgi:mediator of RNA polymerase II transcription subunit 21
MSNSIAYLTSRANFVQVSPDVPVTMQRNPEKVDTPEVFEGMRARGCFAELWRWQSHVENKKELVQDLMVKAKQVEYLINALPVPEPEETQVHSISLFISETEANKTLGFATAVTWRTNDSSQRRIFPSSQTCQWVLYSQRRLRPHPAHWFLGGLHQRITEVLRDMLNEPDCLDNPG